MSAKPNEAKDGDEKAPAKSKKMLIIGLAVVLVLVLGGGGAFFYISKQRAAAEDEDDHASSAKSASHAAPKVAPTYMPLDNMVVNLADPGGERVAQVGITLEVVDAKAVETVKAFLPTIRSAVLMLISQRKADELLSAEGKQKLAQDILRETKVPFGGGEDEEQPSNGNANGKQAKKKKAQPQYPVVGVLFSSFIVQ